MLSGNCKAVVGHDVCLCLTRILKLELVHFHVLQRPARSGTPHELVDRIHHFEGPKSAIHFELKHNSKQLNCSAKILEVGSGVCIMNEFCNELNEWSFEGLSPNCENLLITLPSKLDSLMFCTIRDFFGSNVRRLSQT